MMVLWLAFALSLALTIYTGWKAHVYGRRFERWRVGSRMLHPWGVLYIVLLFSAFMLFLWAMDGTPD